MPLPGFVQKAQPGLIGFDHSSQRLTLAEARTYASKGYKFCARYISRTPETRQGHEDDGTPDLSQAEAQDILTAGLALFAVQHVAPHPWSPSQELGTEYGENAATYASSAGLAEGVNVFLDLEDVATGTDPQAIIDYANAWFNAVSVAGYTPGLYVGFNVWLTPEQLFFNLKFKHYWRAPGNIVDVAHRGYQLFQNETNGFDSNVTRDDALGDGVLWHTAAAPAAPMV